MMISNFTSRRRPDVLFSLRVLLLIPILASRLTGDFLVCWMLGIHSSGALWCHLVGFFFLLLSIL
jgi:hypothetical protein